MSENKTTTWRLIKRPPIFETFTTNILPKFENGINIIKDRFGEWNISVELVGCVINPSTDVITSIFDHDEATSCGFYDSGYKAMNTWVYINLPKDVEICPTDISVISNGSWYNKHYVQGLNVKTGIWETITNTTSPNLTSALTTPVLQNFTVNDIGKSNYYSAFRLNLYYPNRSSANSCAVFNFSIHGGTIQY